MSTAELIAPHLPYLRRYARALAGTQESGDKYVVSLLETLVSDPDMNIIETQPKIDLFRAFTKIWQSISLNQKTEPNEDAAERNVGSLSALPRQAFLLTAVEGFDKMQAASILSIETDEVAQLLEQAGKEIAEQVATSILIIEDEPLIAMDIEQMVESLGHEVTGIARTHTEALAAIEERKPGMVLADINLADGSSGIDAVNDILKSINVPVIFITAFPEKLLTGDRPEPAFLISKPFMPDTVKALVSQALFFEQNAGEDKAA
ncbi:response regulator [Pseudahrensia aquimaris]|uniref:Response regulator n=1 Tax=Pseudahrensia aquimaris TaxID=744461 RepID=A0ABW3FDF2_9HYPH